MALNVALIQRKVKLTFRQTLLFLKEHANKLDYTIINRPAAFLFYSTLSEVAHDSTYRGTWLVILSH